MAMCPRNVFPNPLRQACWKNAFDRLLCSKSQKGGMGPGLVYGEPHVTLVLSQTSVDRFFPTITAVIYKIILTIAKGLIKTVVSIQSIRNVCHTVCTQSIRFISIIPTL